MRVVDSGAGAYWVLGKEVLEAVRGYFNGNLTGRQALAIVRLSLLFPDESVESGWPGIVHMLKLSVAISTGALVSMVLVTAMVTRWDTAQGSTDLTTNSCATGNAVELPALNPGLVSDCETLISARDILAGGATLDWSVETPMADWEGVILDGTPPRVTELYLRNRGLTGSVPAELGSLSQPGSPDP